jgi:hypothetical protein
MSHIHEILQITLQSFKFVGHKTTIRQTFISKPKNELPTPVRKNVNKTVRQPTLDGKVL